MIMLFEPDAEQLRKNYRSFTDERILRLYTEEASKLRPEALELLKEEIVTRGLDRGIFVAGEEGLVVDEGRLEEFISRVRDLPCPVSGSTARRLNGATVSTTSSFLLITNVKKRPVIASPEVLDALLRKANNSTLLAGWWGFPWGPARTVRSLILNNNQRKKVQEADPTVELRRFVLAHVRELEDHQNDPEALLELVKKYNR